MPSKTTDIETAILLDLGSGPVTIGQMIANGYSDDPRWTGVALMHLRRDGRIRYTTCEPEHNHGGDCTVELIGA